MLKCFVFLASIISRAVHKTTLKFDRKKGQSHLQHFVFFPLWSSTSAFSLQIRMLAKLFCINAKNQQTTESVKCKLWVPGSISLEEVNWEDVSRLCGARGPWKPSEKLDKRKVMLGEQTNRSKRLSEPKGCLHKLILNGMTYSHIS